MMRNLYVLLIFTVLICPSLYAAEITKVKGSNALVELKGDAAAVGDSFFALSSDGKKRGILQITKIKGDKAIARIIKGKAEAGMSLQARGGAGSSTHSTKSTSAAGRSYWGAMLGVSQDSMQVQVNNFFNGQPTQTVSITGTSFSGMGLFDYEMFPQIWFRGLGGIEGFNVAGAAVCGTNNTQVCNATIYYLSLDFIARYVFSQGNYRPWLGMGMALMFPASKNSTALSGASIANTEVIQFAGGLDWFISPNFFIPLSIEYGLLPKSNQVNASWIEFRAGVGIPF